MKHPPHGSGPRCPHCRGNLYYTCYPSDIAYIHAMQCLACSRETIIDVTDSDGVTRRPPLDELEGKSRLWGAA